MEAGNFKSSVNSNVASHYLSHYALIGQENQHPTLKTNQMQQ